MQTLKHRLKACIEAIVVSNSFDFNALDSVSSGFWDSSGAVRATCFWLEGRDSRLEVSLRREVHSRLEWLGLLGGAQCEQRSLSDLASDSAGSAAKRDYRGTVKSELDFARHGKKDIQKVAER